MFHELVQLVLHLRETVERWSGEPWFAWALFAVLFAETGLVVFPFLPGDSLLFAVGAVTAFSAAPVELPYLIALMCSAALLGDVVNYLVGRLIGPRVFKSETSRFLSRKHLHRAQAFYEKHGAKTIVIARFVPIIRTFAPFIAGIGRMNYLRFEAFSVGGCVLWVSSLTWCGRQFGKNEWVARHFELVVLAIVAISVIPIAVEAVKARRAAKA